ncbi:MAG: hypothetical protein ABIK89_02420, partial [Planctomycetota bacterium]
MRSADLSRRECLATLLTSCSLPALAQAAEGKPDKEVPWLAEVQRPPKRLPDDAPRLSSLLIDEDGREITTLEGWRRKRETLRRWWIEFLRPLEVRREGPPPLEVMAEDRPEGVVRQLVRYEVEPGLAVEAYLLKPARVERPAAGVVALHSTVNHTIRQPAGVEGKPEKAFGLKMARRGYVVFCPR